jgi:hypothetical protein
MHEHRYDALLDAISDDVEDLGPWTKGERHASTLEQRARDMQPGEPGRAEWFMHAGERWEPARDRTALAGGRAREGADPVARHP